MKKGIKIFTLFIIGGICYMLLEMSWRGRSHWTMGVLGGICFVLIGMIHKVLECSLLIKMAISALLVTVLEFFAGVIININMGLGIWDYSHLPFNILGQVCIPFTILWFALSLIAMIVNDIIRWKLFHEEKPHYSVFYHKS